MPRKYYYLLSLTFVFVIPTLILGYFISDRIDPLQLAIFVTSVTVLGSFYDIWATRHGKKDPVWIWTFNYKDTLGYRFLNVPLEEYLFYTASSIYVVFVWEGIKYSIESPNHAVKFILPSVALWTMLFIALPYFKKEKRDRLR